METHRILAAAVATVVLTSAAQADVRMTLSANRTYFQTNAFNLRFEGGSLDVLLRDGRFVVDGGCPLNGSAISFPPSTVPPCELGATGLVASGDLDGDGVRDDNQYYSIVNNGVIQAIAVAPSRPDLAVFAAGPPSKLQRPLYDFNDETVVVFYNIRGSATDYHLSSYSLNRPYLEGAAELRRMNEEIVSGQYLFTFPHLTQPQIPVPFQVTIAPNLNALDATSRSRTGFRFTSGSWFEQKYQADPRLITPVRWIGNDRTVVRNGDQIFFSILDANQGGIVFPPTDPQNPVLLPTPLAQQYNIAPFFFVVGDEGVMNLEYNRFLPSSGVTYDTSTRDFRANIIFVDSFAGYVQTTFPTGISNRDRSAKGDIDKDLMTNGDEYAFQAVTNENINAAAKAAFEPFSLTVADGRPTIAQLPPGGLAISEKYHSLVSKIPEPITDPTLQPPAPGPVTVDGEGRAVFVVPIRPRTGNTVKYQFQIAPAPGAKKGKKIKLSDWTLTKEITPVTESKTIQIETILATGTALLWTAEVDVTYNIESLRLVSNDPVEDPLDLPQLIVKATPTALK